MSDEDWDKDEYVPQPVKYSADNTSDSGSNADRGKTRGHIRGRTSRGGLTRGNDSLRGTHRGFGDHRGTHRGGTTGSDRSGHHGTENRGGSRGKGDFNRGSDTNRPRGRGRNARSNQTTDKNKVNGGEEDRDSDDEGRKKTVDRPARGGTPPRGARGRTRSCGRPTETGDRSEERGEGRGRLKGRGRGARHVGIKSDGEDSEKSDAEDVTKPMSSRGRASFQRSKSFRGMTSGGNRGTMRGGRGRGRGGRAPAEEEKKPPEKYIPPEPTEDEDLMFHSGITTGVHFNKYDSIEVEVTGENVPKPIRSFELAGLGRILLDNIAKSGYKKPTPVQKNALPIVMELRDLMACAQTGSGKTAAFLIPLIDKLLDIGRAEESGCEAGVEPQAIILSPTRELAIQIFQEARKFAHGSHIKVALVYGGTVVQHQLNQIKRGCHILVAVPGRLESFVKSNHIKFSKVKFFVLDEADRMLELGFKESVRRILSHETMPKKEERVTLMFSATFPQEIQELASEYLNNYLFLAVGVVGGACSDVQQLFHKVQKFDKKDKLLEILKETRTGDELTLVFVGMKRHADFLAVYLCENELPTTSIHGDRYQSQREEALTDFKTGKRPILIATAVAARGLDIKNVAHVINYDLPKTIEEYVHRIGRTGRVGNCGRSTSFYDSAVDRPLSNDLLKILQQAGQEIPDFLREDAASSRFTASSTDEFAGTDIRTTANQNQRGSSGAKGDDEECWD